MTPREIEDLISVLFAAERRAAPNVALAMRAARDGLLDLLDTMEAERAALYHLSGEPVH